MLLMFFGLAVMALPQRFPFQSSVFYDGRERAPLAGEELKAVLRYDPDYEKREEFRKEYADKVLLPFRLFLHKYSVLKSIFQNKEKPKNVTLHNILEDALRQNVTDLDATMLAFIHFVNRCSGNFLTLFKRNAHHPISNIMISSSSANPDKQKILMERKVEIDLKSAKLFSRYNFKGNPSGVEFEKLKTEIEGARMQVRTYRDQVAAHDDKAKPIVKWGDLDMAVNRFKEITDDFFTVGSFSMSFGEASGPGFSAKKTIEILLNGMFKGLE
jgi:hypothetical protein